MSTKPAAAHNAVPLTGGTGTGALATVVVAATGIVTSATLQSYGPGYVEGNVLSASNTNLGGSGSGFAFTLLIAGAISNAGSGYTPGTYNPVALTGGSGSGAQADVVVSSGGQVSAVTVLTNGTGGYVAGDVLSSSGLGPGSGFKFALTGFPTQIGNVQLIGNQASYNNQANVLNRAGISITNANDVLSVGNVIHHDGNGSMQTDGIYIDPNSAFVTSSGDTIYDEGQGGTSGVGIVVQAGAARINISGDTIYDDQATQTMKYGLQGTCATLSFCVVTHNNLGSFTTAADHITYSSDSYSDDINTGILTFNNQVAFADGLLGQVNFSGTTPSVSGAGSPASIAGNDNVGRVTAGSSPGSAITITFAAQWSNAPVCFAVDETTAGKNPLNVSLISRTRVIFTAQASLANGDIVGYECKGYQ